MVNVPIQYVLHLGMPDNNTTRVSIVPYGIDGMKNRYRWQEDDLFDVFYVEHEVNKYYAQPAVGIDSISENGQCCNINLSLREQPKSKLSIYGVTGAPIKYNVNRVCIALNLTRTDKQQRVPMFFNAAVEPVDGLGLVICHSLVAYEVLHVKNLSNQKMEFRLAGPVADKLWYYENAAYYLPTPTASPMLTDEKFTENTIFSGPDMHKPDKIYNANPGEEVLIYSWYRPNEEKLKDVSLVAFVNGERVQTSNKLSSDLKVEIGNVYHMYCVWDGQKFAFGRTSTDEDGENGLIEGGTIGYQLPDAWIDGSGDNYGTERGEGNLNGTGSGYIY
ncbi:MAG: hypothetical protein KBT39_08330 [Bacteroidales bacterium]|nr:hypothetical protein [Bacteroidales bacterium]